MPRIHRLHVLPAVLGAMFLSVMLLPTAAMAQSDADLRRENSALRARVAELEAELQAARKQIRDLEARNDQLVTENARLRRGSAGSPADTEPEPEQVSIDESEPDASPRALFRAIRESYQDRFADMDPDTAGSRERDAYVRAVRRWTATVNREYRQPVSWTVRVIDAEPAPRGIVLTMQAVDPETDVQLGEPFPGLVNSRTLQRRLEVMNAEGSLMNEKLVIRGVLMPEVRANADRESEGTFNNPPFIGPFAEFIFGIDLQSVQSPAEAAESDRSSERQPS